MNKANLHTTNPINRMKYVLFFLFLSASFFGCGGIDEDLLVIPTVTSLPGLDEMAFVQITDTHNSMVSFVPALSVMRAYNCDFGFISGDIIPPKEMLDSVNKFSKPFLMIPGNHDATDGYGQVGFRYNVLNAIRANNNVHFGSSDANYWYKDIYKNGHNLRVIGLDQFECKVNASFPVTSSDTVPRNQVDWFTQVLSHSEACDGIIVIMHCGFGTTTINVRDTNNVNSFISILAKNFKNNYDYDFSSYQDPRIYPDIVKAYITGNNIKNKVYKKGYQNTNLTVHTNFTGPHHNFIGYFGGHLHWDEVEYLHDYPNQLQVLMAYCGDGTGSNYNDLIKSGSRLNSFNVNLNVINFTERTLKIFRIGAKQKIDGTTRDSISFKY